MSEALNAAKAELQRRQAVAAAQAELTSRQAAATPEDELRAIMDGSTGQIQSQIDASERVGATAAAALNKAGESMTLGIVGDEAAGAFDAAIGRGDRAERTQFYRNQEADLKENHPGLALAAEIAPAFIPGAGAAGAIAKLGTKVGRVAAGAAAGATAGGIYGFAEGDDGNRLENARNTALLGGIFGAAAPKAADFAASVPGRVRRMFSKSAARPTVEGLRAAKNAAYKAVDESGEVFDGAVMTQLSDGVKKAFDDDGGYVEGVDTALDATLKILGRRSGQKTTLPQIDKIRRNLWKRYAANPDQPQILDAISAIDDVIETRGGASDLMKVARAANSRFAKSELLDDAFTKAADQTAGAGSGGNILNKYRQAITSIINDDRKARFFTQQEIDMMRAFNRGSTAENVARKIGKLSPNGNGLMMALHVVGGMASDGATLPIMAVGAVAKSAADRSAMRGAGAIQDTLAGLQRPVPSVASGLSDAAVAVGAAPAAERLQDAIPNKLNRFRTTLR